MKQYTISHVSDFAKLTPEEFERMLPDFLAWHEIANSIDAPGVEHQAFVWVDDGLPGQIHSVTLTVKETGEKLEYVGPAFGATE